MITEIPNTMENPEAYLDVLTIRSLRERYHGSHDEGFTDQSASSLLPTNHEDLEKLVRDFTIDDSISDCFANSAYDTSSLIGVDCKPSSKALPSPSLTSTPKVTSQAVNKPIDVNKTTPNNASNNKSHTETADVTKSSHKGPGNFVTNLFHRKGKNQAKASSKTEGHLSKGGNPGSPKDLTDNSLQNKEIVQGRSNEEAGGSRSESNRLKNNKAIKESKNAAKKVSFSNTTSDTDSSSSSSTWQNTRNKSKNVDSTRLVDDHNRARIDCASSGAENSDFPDGMYKSDGSRGLITETRRDQKLRDGEYLKVKKNVEPAFEGFSSNLDEAVPRSSTHPNKHSLVQNGTSWEIPENPRRECAPHLAFSVNRNSSRSLLCDVIESGMSYTDSADTTTPSPRDPQWRHSQDNQGYPLYSNFSAQPLHRRDREDGFTPTPWYESSNFDTHSLHEADPHNNNNTNGRNHSGPHRSLSLCDLIEHSATMPEAETPIPQSSEPDISLDLNLNLHRNLEPSSAQKQGFGSSVLTSQLRHQYDPSSKPQVDLVNPTKLQERNEIFRRQNYHKLENQNNMTDPATRDNNKRTTHQLDLNSEHPSNSALNSVHTFSNGNSRYQYQDEHHNGPNRNMSMPSTETPLFSHNGAVTVMNAPSSGANVQDSPSKEREEDEEVGVHRGSSSDRHFWHLVSAMERADLETLIHELGIMPPSLASALTDAQGNTLAHVGVLGHHKPALNTVLVLQPGLQDIVNERGEIPAVTAVKANNPDCLDILLSHPSPHHVTKSSQEMTSLAFMAASLGHTHCLLCLCRHMGGAEWATSLRDEDGNTLLHEAAANGHTDMVMMLMSMGCNPCEKNCLAYSPWQLATNSHRAESSISPHNNSNDNNSNNNNNNISGSYPDTTQKLNEDKGETAINPKPPSMNSDSSDVITQSSDVINGSGLKYEVFHSQTPESEEKTVNREDWENTQVTAQTDDVISTLKAVNPLTQIFAMDRLTFHLVEELSRRSHQLDMVHGELSKMNSSLQAAMDLQDTLPEVISKLKAAVQREDGALRNREVHQAMGDVDSATNRLLHVLRDVTETVSGAETSTGRHLSQGQGGDDSSRDTQEIYRELLQTTNSLMQSNPQQFDLDIRKVINLTFNKTFIEKDITHHVTTFSGDSPDRDYPNVTSDSKFANVNANSNLFDTARFNVSSSGSQTRKQSTGSLCIDSDQKYPNGKFTSHWKTKESKLAQNTTNSSAASFTSESRSGVNSGSKDAKPLSSKLVEHTRIVRKSFLKENDIESETVTSPYNSLARSFGSASEIWAGSDAQTVVDVSTKGHDVIDSSNKSLGVSQSKSGYGKNVALSRHPQHSTTCSPSESKNQILSEEMNFTRNAADDSSKQIMDHRIKENATRPEQIPNQSYGKERFEGLSGFEPRISVLWVKSHSDEILTTSRRSRRNDALLTLNSSDPKGHNGKDTDITHRHGRGRGDRRRNSRSRSISGSRPRSRSTSDSRSQISSRSQSETRLRPRSGHESRDRRGQVEGLFSSSDDEWDAVQNERRGRIERGKEGMEENKRSSNLASENCRRNQCSHHHQRPHRHHHHHPHHHQCSSSSRQSSSRERKKQPREKWSDDCSDDIDDDDEEEEEEDEDEDVVGVRVNVEAEDLPDEALRAHRLQRHLQSIQRLRQRNDDVIETVITGTGERLTSQTMTSSEVSHVNIGQEYPFKRSSSSGPTVPVMGTSAFGKKVMGKLQKSSKMKKSSSAPRLFNHEKQQEEMIVRELSQSEFEDTYDRRYDVTVRRRREMDQDIPWDQLHFSESETEFSETAMTLEPDRSVEGRDLDTESGTLCSDEPSHV